MGGSHTLFWKNFIAIISEVVRGIFLSTPKLHTRKISLCLLTEKGSISGACFIKQVYQISQTYFSNSDSFSLDLFSESKITITQAQSLWQLMLRN